MLRLARTRATGVRDAVVRRVFVATRGRVPARWGGLPALVLVTRGRRTGHERTTMLVTPASRGEELVLVASNGGADRDPDWLLNLRACPDVEVLAGGQRRRMTARLATSEERAQLWPAVEARSPAYARYRRATTRDIPLVLLRPR